MPWMVFTNNSFTPANCIATGNTSGSIRSGTKPNSRSLHSGSARLTARSAAVVLITRGGCQRIHTRTQICCWSAGVEVRTERIIRIVRTVRLVIYPTFEFMRHHVTSPKGNIRAGVYQKQSLQMSQLFVDGNGMLLSPYSRKVAIILLAEFC